MMTTQTIQQVVVFFGLATIGATAFSASLRPGRTTDTSVCDMAHETNAYLGGKLFVPAVAAPKDQADAFFRLGAAFIASSCSDGQLLILQGLSNVNADTTSLTQVAYSACKVADVKRTESTSSSGDYKYPIFELRCTIAKHTELQRQLADLERTDPMESLKARLTRSVEEARKADSPRETNAGTAKDCGKLTFGSVIAGLGGHCK